MYAGAKISKVPMEDAKQTQMSFYTPKKQKSFHFTSKW